MEFKHLPRSPYWVAEDGTVLKQLHYQTRGSKRTITLKHPSGRKVRRDVDELVRKLFGAQSTKSK